MMKEKIACMRDHARRGIGKSLLTTFHFTFFCSFLFMNNHVHLSFTSLLTPLETPHFLVGFDFCNDIVRQDTARKGRRLGSPWHRGDPSRRGQSWSPIEARPNRRHAFQQLHALLYQALIYKRRMKRNLSGASAMRCWSAKYRIGYEIIFRIAYMNVRMIESNIRNWICRVQLDGFGRTLLSRLWIHPTNDT